jgi:hypothetical protein
MEIEDLLLLLQRRALNSQGLSQFQGRPVQHGVDRPTA